MRSKKIQLILTLFLSTLFIGLNAQTLEQRVDKIITSNYGEDEPGVTVLVAKSGKPIFRKAYGMADLELGVKMKPEMVFEIGSITKQFTAVSILMLMEQGKLSLDDEITKFIPDYPTHDKKKTVHNLLNHTSGIKSYTNLASFLEKARVDMSPMEIINSFKNEPMDFDPGEKFLYNNSGYIILGYIIEKVSGQTYEDFIEKNIFEKLAMTNSYYGSMKEIIKNRASGYQPNENGYRNADYLSLTLPYAAGSIMSNVDDLLKWQEAVKSNKLIKEETLALAVNGSKLNSGEEINYGYGWGKTDIQGYKGYEHGGGIFGYTTNGIYLMDDDVYAIALTNSSCKNIGAANTQIAALAIGKPFPTKADAIVLNEDDLKKWTGIYKFEDALRQISYEDGGLISQRQESTKMKIYPLSETHFIFEDGATAYHFEIKDGKNSVKMKAGSNEREGIATDESFEEERATMEVSPEILKSYIGNYELQKGFVITMMLENGKLFTQATGQPKFPIFAESESKFFLKVVPATVEFNKGDNGEIESLTLNQGGQSMVAKKIE